MAKNFEVIHSVLVCDQVCRDGLAKRAIVESTHFEISKMALFAGPWAGAVLACAMAVLI